MKYIALLQTHICHGTGILTYIYHKIPTIHVGKYTIRPMDSYGKFNSSLPFEHHRAIFKTNQHLENRKQNTYLRKRFPVLVLLRSFVETLKFFKVL